MAQIRFGNHIIEPTRWATNDIGFDSHWDAVNAIVPVDGRLIAFGAWVGGRTVPQAFLADVYWPAATGGGPSNNNWVGGGYYDDEEAPIHNLWTTGVNDGRAVEAVIQGSPIILSGWELAAFIYGDWETGNGVRMAQVYKPGGGFWRWDSGASGVWHPSDYDYAMWLVVEENRPPVISAMTPVNGDVLVDTTPTFTLLVTDPDRADGYNDYPTNAIIHIWEKDEGAYTRVGSQVFALSDPGAGTDPVPLNLTWTSALTPGKTYGWTVEVWDQIAGQTGIGYGGRNLATDEPDGTTDFMLVATGVAQGGSPGTKIYTETPTPLSTTYFHPGGTTLDSYQVRILKLSDEGQYVAYRTSEVIDVAALASASPISIDWADTFFGPLEFGGRYALEWQFKDTLGVTGEWSGRTYFWINEPPNKASGISPSDGTPTTGRPTVLFSAVDQDDPASPWFPELGLLTPAWAIGGTGALPVAPTLDWPWGIATRDSDDHIFVANTGANAIVEMDATGTRIRSVPVANAEGAYALSGVAVDPSGRVFVAVRDQLLSGGEVWGVVRYTSDLTSPYEFPDIFFAIGDGIRDLATDGSTVWITAYDTYVHPNGSLWSYNANTGVLTNRIDIPDTELGGIAHNGTHIYVIDKTNWLIHRYTHGLVYVSSSAALPNAPQGISIDNSGNLVVTFPGAGTIRRYHPTTFALVDTISAPPADVWDVDMDDAGDLWTTLYKASAKTNLRHWTFSGGAWIEYVPPVTFTMNDAGQVARDNSGNLYIADTANNRLLKSDATGAVLGSVSSLTGITGVAFDGTDIFVTYGPNIRRYNTSLVLQDTEAVGGKAFGQLSTDGTNLYIARPTANVVSVYANGTLNFVRTIGKSGRRKRQFSNPVATAVRGDILYVIDQGNFRVQAFRLNDNDSQLGEWGDEGIGTGQFLKPTSIAIAPLTGNVYVTDDLRGDVQVFSWDAWYLGRFGLPWSDIADPGVIRNPRGIATGPDDEAYITDAYFDRVTAFETLTTESASNYGAAGEVEISGPYSITNADFEGADMTPWIYDENHVSFTAVVSQVTPGRDGTGKAARIALSAAPSVEGVGFWIESEMQPCVQDEWYTAGAWVRRSTDQYDPVIMVRFYHLDEDNNWIFLDYYYGNASQWFPFVNSWGEVRFSFQAPTWATGFTVCPAAISNSATPGLVNIDWDDVYVEPSVRYIRPAVNVAGSSYLYVTTEDDLEILGAYDVRARGRDQNNAGPWSSPTNFQYVSGPTATILDPEPGEVLNTTTPVVRWFMTSGEQWRFKVEAMDAVTGVIVYDSDWITEPETRQHRIPPGYLADGGSYLARLWIDDTKLQVLV